jgi:hypothetical protein
MTKMWYTHTWKNNSRMDYCLFFSCFIGTCTTTYFLLSAIRTAQLVVETIFQQCLYFDSWYRKFYYTHNEVVGGGGILESVCPSIRLSWRPSVFRRNGFRALDTYPYHLESPYHTYRLPIGGKSSLLILRSKGQRSSALDIKVEIRFPSSRQLSLPPRITISHI